MAVAEAGSGGSNNDDNVAIATNNGTMTFGRGMTASAGSDGSNDMDNTATFTNNGTINVGLNDTVTVAAGSEGSNNIDNSATVTNTETGTINGPITLGSVGGTDLTGEDTNITNDGTLGP